ncbi:carbon-nitrogen hydrolase family protein [Pseudarthrobacter raffinosi]|uniref:carbon-nitrogen hydrolase family protein n=1 Tax=Pseudarthrobacter raffinosi TaxID=2953651 RepID=UPI00208FDF5A|nr:MULTISPECIES: carbon-nitrogen hydrolase family protein [unclassified Pseudarthrobacter]MCO4239705.1 carbon-nitrogen hydrolase family protein [Pseudarthrobacter sp. MDT3-28]MCO4261368.1 carbon-nitrogen hydrolase family protein [Pseudarthrobacter sp. MDT3-26]
MLLALMQANARVLDVDANCAALDAAARAAAGEGAAVLVTPELFPVGYAPLRLRAELDPAGLPAIREALEGIARRHGIGLVYSLPSVTDGGSWHITSTLVDATGGELLTYAKVHLFGDDERAAFSPAEAGPAVVDFNGFRTSMVICYDVEFPESVRAAALGGAELLLVPTALAHGFEAVPQVLLRARALESQLTIAYANHSGTEDGCEFLGGSVIAGPDGSLLATAGPGAELLFAEVDPDAARITRDVMPYLRERRPELYRSWGI